MRELESGPNVVWCVAAVSVGKGQAASAAFHSSDIVDIRIPSLPVLNWRFGTFSANSIPLMVIAALSNRLNPSIGRIRCFTRAVIPFDQVVQVLARLDPHCLGEFPYCLHLPHCAMRRRIEGVQRDLRRFAPVLHRLAEKALGRIYIALSTQEEIHGPTGFVHSSIQVDPASTNL